MTNVDENGNEIQDVTPPAEAAPSGEPTNAPSQQGLESETISRAEFEAYKKQTDGRVGGLQGAWDKQSNALVERMKKLGVELSPQQERDNMFLDMQNTIQQLTSSPQGLPASEPVQTPLSYADVIKAQELDANNPDVLNAAIKFQSNPTEFKAALVDIKVSNTHAPATQAAIVQPGGAGAPSPVSLDEAQRKVSNLLADRNSVMTAEGRQKLAEARKQLEELEQRG